MIVAVQERMIVRVSRPVTRHVFHGIAAPAETGYLALGAAIYRAKLLPCHVNQKAVYEARRGSIQPRSEWASVNAVARLQVALERRHG